MKKQKRLWLAVILSLSLSWQWSWGMQNDGNYGEREMPFVGSTEEAVYMKDERAVDTDEHCCSPSTWSLRTRFGAVSLLFPVAGATFTIIKVLGYFDSQPSSNPLSPNPPPPPPPVNPPPPPPVNPPLLEMIVIPEGSFEMGDSTGTYSNELPVHEVTISEFELSRYELTYGEWTTMRAWANMNGYTDLASGQAGSSTNNPDTHPVTYVSWYDSVKWCNALSEKEGLTPVYTVNGSVYKIGKSDNVVMNINANGYRLPTEAEWEKAARGGLAAKVYPWGDSINDNYAVYNYNSGGTLPVGSKSLGNNGYGLSDMTGNVWAWTWDWHSVNYYKTSPGADPEGPRVGTLRVIRGGSWDGTATQHSRVAFRGRAAPSYDERSTVGLRPCRRSS